MRNKGQFWIVFFKTSPEVTKIGNHPIKDHPTWDGQLRADHLGRISINWLLKRFG